MTQENNLSTAPSEGTAKKATPRKDLPGWTNGLRELYDKVVDEEIPDTFRDLLARLDESK